MNGTWELVNKGWRRSPSREAWIRSCCRTSTTMFKRKGERGSP
jgi:hypothetical protein